jgi:transposase
LRGLDAPDGSPSGGSCDEGRYEAAEFNQLEAAELLGVSERTFRRWQARYEEDGEAGLLDRRLGKASGKRVPVDRAQEVEALYRQRYAGFRAKHFHEHLVKDHGFAWGYTWTKTFLQSRELLPKASRKGAHRRKRERRPLPGMMLHQDCGAACKSRPPEGVIGVQKSAIS